MRFCCLTGLYPRKRQESEVKEMKEKRMIRLINDERTLRSVKKVSACDLTSYDGGCGEVDAAVCRNYARDEYCDKDYASCVDGARDICDGAEDVFGCGGTASAGYEV